MSDAKVWLVTSGAYSDYHIVAAFTTEELARGYAKHIAGDYGHGEADVEEWDLHDTLPVLLDWLHLSSRLFADGSTHVEAERVEQHWADDKASLAALPRIGIDDSGSRYSSPNPPVAPHVIVSTEGVDHDRVRKVHSEATAVAKARVLELLAPDPESKDAGSVNYRLSYELVEEMNLRHPWRALMEHQGWGAVVRQLERAGLAHDQAYQLAEGVWLDRETADAPAAAAIDRILGESAERDG